MNEGKFTKGPWQFENNERPIISTQRARICGMFQELDCSDREEMEANASLIAAAPHMYEALKFECETCQGNWLCYENGQPSGAKNCRIGKALMIARGEMPIEGTAEG